MLKRATWGLLVQLQDVFLVCTLIVQWLFKKNFVVVIFKCLNLRDVTDTVERCTTRAELGSNDPHGVKGLGALDVEATAFIH
jgi:hypothetical protein